MSKLLPGTGAAVAAKRARAMQCVGTAGAHMDMGERPATDPIERRRDPERVIVAADPAARRADCSMVIYFLLLRWSA